MRRCGLCGAARTASGSTPFHPHHGLETRVTPRRSRPWRTRVRSRANVRGGRGACGSPRLAHRAKLGQGEGGFGDDVRLGLMRDLRQIVTVHALQARGTGGWLNGALDTPDNHLDQPVDDQNIYPGIQRPHEGDDPPAPEPGFHLQPEHFPWFRRVLARTAAGRPDGLRRRWHSHRAVADQEAGTTPLHQPDPRRHRQRPGRIRTSPRRDFVGTDHVFRLNSPNLSGLMLTVNLEEVRLVPVGEGHQPQPTGALRVLQ